MNIPKNIENNDHFRQAFQNAMIASGLRRCLSDLEDEYKDVEYEVVRTKLTQDLNGIATPEEIGNLTRFFSNTMHSYRVFEKYFSLLNTHDNKSLAPEAYQEIKGAADVLQSLNVQMNNLIKKMMAKVNQNKIDSNHPLKKMAEVAEKVAYFNCVWPSHVYKHAVQQMEAVEQDVQKQKNTFCAQLSFGMERISFMTDKEIEAKYELLLQQDMKYQQEYEKKQRENQEAFDKNEKELQTYQQKIKETEELIEKEEEWSREHPLSDEEFEARRTRSNVIQDRMQKIVLLQNRDIDNPYKEMTDFLAEVANPKSHSPFYYTSLLEEKYVAEIKELDSKIAEADQAYQGEMNRYEQLKKEKEGLIQKEEEAFSKVDEDRKDGEKPLQDSVDAIGKELNQLESVYNQAKASVKKCETDIAEENNRWSALLIDKRTANEAAKGSLKQFTENYDNCKRFAEKMGMKEKVFKSIFPREEDITNPAAFRMENAQKIFAGWLAATNNHFSEYEKEHQDYLKQLQDSKKEHSQKVSSIYSQTSIKRSALWTAEERLKTYQEQTEKIKKSNHNIEIDGIQQKMDRQEEKGKEAKQKVERLKNQKDDISTYLRMEQSSRLPQINSILKVYRQKEWENIPDEKEIAETLDNIQKVIQRKIDELKKKDDFQEEMYKDPGSYRKKMEEESGNLNFGEYFNHRNRLKNLKEDLQRYTEKKELLEKGVPENPVLEDPTMDYPIPDFKILEETIQKENIQENQNQNGGSSKFMKAKRMRELILSGQTKPLVGNVEYGSFSGNPEKRFLSNRIQLVNFEKGIQKMNQVRKTVDATRSANEKFETSYTELQQYKVKPYEELGRQCRVILDHIDDTKRFLHWNSREFSEMKTALQDFVNSPDVNAETTWPPEDYKTMQKVVKLTEKAKAYIDAKRAQEQKRENPSKMRTARINSALEIERLTTFFLKTFSLNEESYQKFNWIRPQNNEHTPSKFLKILNQKDPETHQYLYFSKPIDLKVVGTGDLKEGFEERKAYLERLEQKARQKEADKKVQQNVQNNPRKDVGKEVQKGPEKVEQIENPILPANN